MVPRGLAGAVARLRRQHDRVVFFPDFLGQQVDDMLGRGHSVADRGVEGADIGQSHLGGDDLEGFLAHQRGCGDRMAAHRSSELFAAVFDRLFAALLREPLADLAAGTRALDEAEPVTTGSGVFVLRGEDLDGVAVLQLRVQGDEAAVDAGAHGFVSDLGVHGIGEVDRGGTGGQAHHLALGCEDVDLLRIHLIAEAVEEFVGVGDLALPVQ